MRVIRTDLSPPAPPDDWLTVAQGATRSTEVQASDYNRALLAATVAEVEGYCRKFWSSGASDAARTAKTVVVVGYDEVGFDLPLIVARPTETNATLSGARISRNRGPWEDVTVDVAPWGVWKPGSEGIYELSCSVVVNEDDTPPDVIEAIARVWGYRYVHRPGSGGGTDVEPPTPESNAIRRSGAGGLLLRHRAIFNDWRSANLSYPGLGSF